MTCLSHFLFLEVIFVFLSLKWVLTIPLLWYFRLTLIQSHERKSYFLNRLLSFVFVVESPHKLSLLHMNQFRFVFKIIPLLVVFAVYSCYWYLEHWVHLWWNAFREATFSREKCGPSIGSYYWSSWHPFYWYHCKGLFFSLCKFLLYGYPFYSVVDFVHLNQSGISWCLQIKNDKARRYLSSMRKKSPAPLSQRIPHADPLALKLLERLIAFDPRDRPSADEVRFRNTYYLYNNYSTSNISINIW